MTMVRFLLPAPTTVWRMNMYRWLAFVCAVSSLFLLTSGKIELQWIGWSMSGGSCLAWAYFAYQDKDTPRFLMEGTYFVAALWGVYYWIGLV